MIEGIPLIDWGATTVLAVVFLMVITGKLVTPSHLKEKQKECDYWKAAYEHEREARDERNEQFEEMFELARTSNAMIKAVLENTTRPKKEGD